MISWRRATAVPKLCHSIGAKSGTLSRFLLNSNKAASRVSGLFNSLIHWNTYLDEGQRDSPVNAKIRTFLIIIPN